MPNNLPPLNSVRAFDAAARHMNFSRAGEELGVTQGAISKQILLLEDFIGVKLFERLPGRLELTDEGYKLSTAIAPVFSTLGKVFTHFSRRPTHSKIFRLSTFGSFAAHFLVPRLDDFEQTLPDIQLELLASDRLVDFSREEIDLSVRYGYGNWDGVVSHKMCEGELVPVCAPRLLKDQGDDLTALVTQSRRIQVFTGNEWRKWSEVYGIDLSNSPRAFIVEDFYVAARAAQAGQGLALLPKFLIYDRLKTGDLVVFNPELIPWPKTYYVVHALNAQKSPNIKKVTNWLLAEAASVS